MRLCEGEVGKTYQVQSMKMAMQTERRLEVLGMLEGTVISVVNRKKRGAMIIKIRGTRFAIGEQITKNIEVEPV